MPATAPTATRVETADDDHAIASDSEGHRIAIVDGADVWGYVDITAARLHPAGYAVQATDGRIGKVDRASNEPGSRFLVVDVGHWAFRRKVVLPTDIVERVDPDTETVLVGCTRDEIRNAPEYDEEAGVGEDFPGDLDAFYAARGRLPRRQRT